MVEKRSALLSVPSNGLIIFSFLLGDFNSCDFTKDYLDQLEILSFHIILFPFQCRYMVLRRELRLSLAIDLSL